MSPRWRARPCAWPRPVIERILGPDNLDTLIARATLAHWTGVAGDAAGARDQLAALLPHSERILGPDDHLTIRGDLAYWTGEAGDAVGARDQFSTLVPVIERVLGPDHPRALNACNNLTYWAEKAAD